MSHDVRLGYVEGWKIMAYSEEDGLTSGVKNTQWDSPVMDATCLYEKHEHPIVSEFCTCGVYAGRTLDEALPYYLSHGKGHMIARVRGYGVVREGDKAWRAEHAEITAIYRSRRLFETGDSLPFDFHAKYRKDFLRYWGGLAVLLVVWALSMIGGWVPGHPFINAAIFLLVTGIVGLFGSRLMFAGLVSFTSHLKFPKWKKPVWKDEILGIPVYGTIAEFNKATGCHLLEEPDPDEPYWVIDTHEREYDC